MTQPTFQELLTSQEARDRAELFWPDDEHKGHWMNLYGKICESGKNPVTQMAIWQGYLQEAAPPPEPRVFREVRYRNVYPSGICAVLYQKREHADNSAGHDRTYASALIAELLRNMDQPPLDPPAILGWDLAIQVIKRRAGVEGEG